LGVTEEQLKQKTKDFAHRCIKVASSISSSAIPGNHLARQLIRGSTSVAANYRSVCLAHSKAGCIAKISVSY
jgi:four helix bundle protein